MSKQIQFSMSERLVAEPEKDAYLVRIFPLRDRLRRQLWNLCWLLFFRPSPRPFHSWRVLLLRLFGAKLGPHCLIYPKSKVWAPWNLVCEDVVTAGDGAEIYNPGLVRIGSHAIVSQDGYICGATHDYNDPAFPFVAYSMEIGPYAWICARASVGPGVNVGEGAVLGLGSVATSDLEPWTVYAGLPAVKIKPRKHGAEIH